MSRQEKLSIYLSFLLRHCPEDAQLSMDPHGWVPVSQLIANISAAGRYQIDEDILRTIVAQDKKGRYRFNEDQSKIKACQGHSIPWVTPELTTAQPPQYLYHGTTTIAFQQIKESGAISKMARHAVHMQAVPHAAWKSALRWKKTPILLTIDAAQMANDGYVFGVSDNDVWCTETVPMQYIVEKAYRVDE